ncbi:tetratricopeptide repeat-containing sensor histidine kinase [Flavobacterium hydatis]|uniref:histidine kinase n=1 Tax=Flavobacterium hydatis TaxID=991 RepID=A0A086AP98_FLAHY|nr:ATP-binding protein [Flavobacterium hydatis]KFF18512.1 histidine kinase [Flavobacterium hydatis]OXA94556.1 two-component sensor histidine kinase [Flavobacterium hydatis]
MHKNRIVLLLVILLLCLSNQFYAQTKPISKKEILKLSDEAVKLMREAQYERSLTLSRLTLNYAITAKDPYLIAKSYNTIAANFDELTEPDKALFYYNKGLIYAEKTNNGDLKNWLYNNLGNIYCFDKKEYEKGISFYKKSLFHSSKIKDSVQIVFTKLNIAWAYFDIGGYNDGYPYLSYINKFHPKHGDESTLVVLNMLNGMYYNHTNENQKADSFFQKAIKIGHEGNEKSDLCFTYQEYSKFLSKIGKFPEAFKYLSLYTSLNEELNNEEKTRKVYVAGLNLEVDQYKRDIDKIESQYKSKQQSLLSEQSRNKKVVSIMVSLFIVSLILFYFFYQNTKLKQNNRLKDIQSKIQQNIINASIDGQESERKKIALFLHDNISALLSSAGMHLNVFSTQNEPVSEEILKTKFILQEAHDKVRDLSHELLPTLLVRFGLFYALEDLCEKNSNSTILFEYSCTIPSKTRYNEKFEMRIYFIISELLNNIIKHSEASLASVSLTEDNGNLIVNVTDNGKGYKTNKFHIDEGFGLNQIRARIKNLKGEITVVSKIDIGTSIRVEVPIVNLNIN